MSEDAPRHFTSVALSGDKWGKRVGADGQERTFEFAPGVNVLCGPNGSGKSTILTALNEKVKKLQVDGVRLGSAGRQGKVGVKFLDYEKENPRTKSYFDKAMTFQIASMFSSHGQTNRALNSGLKQKGFENCIVLLDEPDQALDFEGVEELVEALEACEANQIILAAHHPLLILYPEFHKVELTEGYCDHVRNTMLKLTEKTDVQNQND